MFLGCITSNVNIKLLVALDQDELVFKGANLQVVMFSLDLSGVDLNPGEAPPQVVEAIVFCV